MEELLVAFQFLTRLPISRIPYQLDSLSRSAKFFPVVGLVIGFGASLLQHILMPHLDRALVAWLVLTFLVLITGGLHEDALADTADAFGGGWNREQVITILRDSRIGSFGALALVLSVLARFLLLSILPVNRFTALVVSAHVLCRWTTLPMGYFLQPARESGGQGARIAQQISPTSLLIGSLLSFAIVVYLMRVLDSDCCGACDYRAEQPLLFSPDRRGHRGLFRSHESTHRDCGLFLWGLDRVTRLFLVRHAETDMAGRFCGHSDPELNERGRQQLAGLVNRLSQPPVRRVYTSDLRRARQTAEAIAKHFGAALHVRPGLREIDFGLWEGLSWSEIEACDPVLAKSWAERHPNSTAPGGESLQRFERRVRAESAFLFATATECPVAVVAHAGFMRVLLTNFYGVLEEEAWKLTQEYGSVVALDTNLIRKFTVPESA